MSRLSNPNSALTLYDHPLGSGCASPRVVPKVEGGGEEDEIPVSIKKSFKELRSVKEELQRQVCLHHFYVLHLPELRH